MRVNGVQTSVNGKKKKKRETTTINSSKTNHSESCIYILKCGLWLCACTTESPQADYHK